MDEFLQPTYLAEQQLLGFFHAKQGYSLKELITSIGLSRREWELIESTYELAFMSESDRYEIDMYFKK